MHYFTYSKKSSVLTSSNALLVLICMSLAPEIVRFIRALAMRLPIMPEMTYSTDVILFSIAALFSLPAIFRRCKLSDFFIVASFYLIYVSSYVLFPENEKSLNFYFLGFFFTVVPAYFIGRVIRLSEVKVFFFKVSVLAVLLSALYYFFISRAKYGDMDTNAERMEAAYALLPNVLIVIWSAFEKPNLTRVGMSLFSVFLMLSFGTRGPNICIILFIAMYLLLFIKWKQKILVGVLIVFIALLLTSYIDFVMLFLSDWLSSFGMSTRIIDMFTDEGLFISQGRDDLNALALNKIRESNGGPYGIAAFSRWTDTYPHNLALQLWLEFGTVLGSVILLTFIIIMSLAFLKSKDMQERTMLLVLFFPGFVHLFLSHTYLTVPQTFMLIGYSIFLINKNKTNSIWKK